MLLAREKDALRKRQSRAAEKDLKISPCKHPRLRKAAEQDVFAWLLRYLGETFYAEFTGQRREMVLAILNAALYGGDQSIAAPRGDGKTSLVEGVVLFCILKGILFFPVILAATGPDAERILNGIREELEENDLLLDDYPEVCVPIRDVAGHSNRAGSQTVNGKRTRIKWTGKYIRFPFVPRSHCSGAMFMTRGLDAAVRGIKVGRHRPDLAIFDDPDTADTAVNEDQAGKIEKKIDRDVAGLAGPGKTLARVLLTTVQTRKSVSFRYTDPAQKPSFNGKRFRLLVKEPDRMDLWEEYIAMRQMGMQHGDVYGRKAHDFYVSQREEMDRGAVLGNPSRFASTVLPDGTAKQISALQFCMDFIADKSREAFDTEFQNNPPEELAAQESGITPNRIQFQVSGHDRKIIPASCEYLTQGIDVHKRSLYCTVRAWRNTPEGFAVGYTIDYPIVEVFGTTYGSDEGVDEAIVRALHTRREQVEAVPYVTEDGREMPINLTLIDAGWQGQAVARFCDEAGIGYYPCVGYGRSAGTVRPNFNEPVASNPNKQMGWRYFCAPWGVQGGWLVHMDADHWKQWEHSRWMSDPIKPGSLLMWGHSSPDPSRLSKDERDHHAYARHICAEVEVEEIIKGALKRYWKSKSDNNHWLDASYRSNVAAAMCGVRLFGMPAPVVYEALPQVAMTMPDGSPFLATER